MEVLGEDLDLTPSYDALNDSDGAQAVLLKVVELDEALQAVDVAVLVLQGTGRARAYSGGRRSLVVGVFLLRPHLSQQRHQRSL